MQTQFPGSKFQVEILMCTELRDERRSSCQQQQQQQHRRAVKNWQSCLGYDMPQLLAADDDTDESR